MRIGLVAKQTAIQVRLTGNLVLIALFARQRTSFEVQQLNPAVKTVN